MDDTTPAQRNAADYLAKRSADFAASLRSRAASLRETAATLDRLANAATALPGGSSRYGSHAEVATKAQHEVLWSLANLNLENLTSAAYALDALRLNPPT